MSSRGSVKIKNYEEISDIWKSRWQDALEKWSPYVRLRNPFFCITKKEEEKEGLSESFAMIRLTDHSVVISIRLVMEHKLEDFPVEIMAHEIGHHVYCPADLTDLGRMMARMRRGLPTREEHAGFIGNLYGDLLINDRLFREHGLKMDKVYISVNQKTSGRLWNFYMRIYEILWSLKSGTLVSMELNDEMKADALLGNRLVRSYSHDWLSGAGRFAALCLPYLLEDESEGGQKGMGVWMDANSAGDGKTMPSGLTEIEDDELTGAVHPSMDDDSSKPSDEAGTGSQGNYREPFEYGQILKSMGIDLSAREIAARYYRERAVPHLIPFPVETKEQSTDPLPEGLDIWDAGSPLDDIDWIESTTRNPVIIPGYTTFKRTYGTTEGSSPKLEPVDLDLYVDCSGSMPDPTTNISYLTLAGAIISISALRSGSRVQATLWSGAKQFMTTAGFVKNEKVILKILTGYFGGGTAFPIHILRDTYKSRKKTGRKVHILHISDNGITTMYDKDEKSNNGFDIAAMALEKAGGGGTMALNLWGNVKDNAGLVRAREQGWEIYAIKDWKDLVKFGKSFSKKHYSREKRT